MKSEELVRIFKEEGGRCQTRDGREARIICVDRDNDYPVVALVEDEGREAWPTTYYTTGNKFGKQPSNADLVAAPKMRYGFTYTYKGQAVTLTRDTEKARDRRKAEILDQYRDWICDFEYEVQP